MFSDMERYDWLTYVVYTNDAITKHMFSDWLTCRVATVGRCYGLAIELGSTIKNG